MLGFRDREENLVRNKSPSPSRRGGPINYDTLWTGLDKIPPFFALF